MTRFLPAYIIAGLMAIGSAHAQPTAAPPVTFQQRLDEITAATQGSIALLRQTIMDDQQAIAILQSKVAQDAAQIALLNKQLGEKGPPTIVNPGVNTVTPPAKQGVPAKAAEAPLDVDKP